MKKIFLLIGMFMLLAVPVGIASAQGPTPATSGLGQFLGDSQTGVTPTPTVDPVKKSLADDGYTAISSGNWYDTAGKPLTNSAYVFMLAASPDPKSDDSVTQIASGIVALRTAYPTATNYHVLLLNGPNVYDASTSANSIQLLTSKLMTADAFIQEIFNSMRTTNLAGATAATSSTPPPTVASSQPVPTRVPTRKPTAASNACNAPGDKARLWVKNGYNGTMRFTVGGDEWGTHDFDIPADGQYHFVDMPPSSKYTYSASIPGVGKANAKLPPYYAGQCYYLTFTP